mmetsp:Transcript_27240/g.41428  ORF Transcript_27240/g.41428 Transcript_27240/m.41428 type:complete len:95 (-) Transcript_27240:296-580(-)
MGTAVAAAASFVTSAAIGKRIVPCNTSESFKGGSSCLLVAIINAFSDIIIIIDDVLWAYSDIHRYHFGVVPAYLPYLLYETVRAYSYASCNSKF